MNSESVIEFGNALRCDDDASALSLLENGRVTIHSVYIYEGDGVRLFRDRWLVAPIIFIAIRFAREQVVRALVRHGASIDSFRDAWNGGSDATQSATSVRDAIVDSNLPALSLCLRLGADLSCVYRTTDSPPKSYSAMKLALGEAMHAPLICLLDERYMTRPVRLGFEEVQALLTLASRGSAAKVCFEVFESRGFDFKALEEMKYVPSDEIPGATSVADFMLSFAQKSGAAELVRYLVKYLGLVSKAWRMEGLRNGVDTDYAQLYGASPPRTDFTKYTCAACEFEGATDFCSRC